MTEFACNPEPSRSIDLAFRRGVSAPILLAPCLAWGCASPTSAGDIGQVALGGAQGTDSVAEPGDSAGEPPFARSDGLHIVDAGNCPPCPDTNPCTHDYPRPDCTCAHDPLPLACNDNNACTTADFCGPDATCAGLPLPATACTDANPCTLDACDPKLGCFHPPADPTTPCDDGNPCTAPDACKAGACSAGPKLPCDCTTTVDCAAKEDGNKCNGTLYCDTTAPPFQCKVLPGSVVVCPAGFDTPCTQLNCLGTTGQCAPLGVNEGGPCSDGNACSVGDHCSVGACLPTGVTTCDDGNPCTVDGCGLAFGCNHKPVADGTGCDADGSLCTQADACTTGSCTAGKPLVCNDGNPCTDDACTPQVGCVATFAAAKCNDGNACTAVDKCADGTCAGKLVNCDDGNVCTVDLCAPAIGCDNVAAPFPCSDGNACTVGDACKGLVCFAGAPASCNDGSACTTDSCGPATGCINAPLPDGTTCTDSAACTGGDACKGGQCIGKPKLWKVQFAADDADHPKRLVALDDGYMSIGYTGDSSPWENFHKAWFVRFDQYGKVLWQTTVGGEQETHAHSAAWQPNGVVFSGYQLGSTKYATLLGLIDAQGVVQWSKENAGCASGYDSDLGNTLATLPSGFACISATKKYGVARFDHKGNLLWDKSFGPATDTVRTLASHATGIVLAGQLGGYWGIPGADYRLSTITAEGTLVWQATYPLAKPTFLSAVVAVGPATVAVGTITESLKYHGHILYAGADGATIWERTYAMPPNWAWAGMATPGLGGIVVIGSIAKPEQKGGVGRYIMVRESNGNERWHTVFEPPDAGLSFVTATDDGVTAVGSLKGSGSANFDGWLVHTDAFGNYSCANSGPCFAMKPTDCDDNNPCTYDQCDAAHNGCWNPKQPDSTQCGAGKVCKAGACQ